MARGRPVANLEFRSAVCKALREAVNRKGWTQSEAARQLQVKRQLINLYVKEKATPSAEFMCYACNLLEIKNIPYKGLNLAEQFKRIRPRLRAVAIQRFLFEQLQKQLLEVEVLEAPGRSIDLRIRIKAVS